MKMISPAVFLLAFLAALSGGPLPARADGAYPPLETGDLIFQTSTSRQSAAILAATGHPFTHMGIIRVDGERVYVIEAAARVGEVPLADWAARGVRGQVAIYRDPSLGQEVAAKIVEAAQPYYGRPYDIFFSLTIEAIYCSELPYLAYAEAGIAIGALQPLSELNFDTPLVRRLIEERWQRHEECTSRGFGFEACYAYVLDQPMVTPASIALDPRFESIVSDFPM